MKPSRSDRLSTCLDGINGTTPSGRTEIEDPKYARQRFISPVLFGDGHVAIHNFSKSLSTDPYYPYEPTKDWIWYKPKEELASNGY